MKPLITVKNLSITANAPILQGVSFTLYEGERLGIVGESGSGKTLLMKSLLCLLPPNIRLESGEIIYQSTNLCTLTEKELHKIRGKEIGMIFQDPMTALNPSLKIGKQIAEGYLRHFPQATQASARQKALELLTQVGVPEAELRLEQYPHLLSGGIRQRVLIAAALAAEPRVLIADEPTTALDVTVQAQILDLLDRLQHDKSILLITHDLSLVAAFCDRVLVMYAGQIVEEATVSELFANPKHPYTQRLLQSIPRIDLYHHRLVPIPGSPPDLSKPHTGCPFAPRCPHAFSRCHEEKPPVVSSSSSHHVRCWL
jgi:oligopeptide transport system ATP-binding protein